MLKGNVYIYEMFYTVVQSELERKDNKLYSGLSKNKYCIGFACDDDHVICFGEGKAKISSQKHLMLLRDKLNRAVYIFMMERKHIMLSLKKLV